MCWQTVMVVVAIFSKPIRTLPTTTRSPSAHVCRHHYPLQSSLPHPVTLEQASHSRTRRAASDNMRIAVFYHQSVGLLPGDLRQVVEDRAVPQAVHYWEEALRVVNRGDTIRVNRKCENNQYFLSPGDTTQYCKNKCVETKCGEFLVPDSHLEACHTCDSTGRNCGEQSMRGPGVGGVDFVLYVSAVTTPQCLESVGGEAETVAYAAHCQQEAGLDRPVAGHTNICPGAISLAERDVRALTSTLKHELLHALGFSSSLFAFFRDTQGRPRTPREDDGRPPVNQQLQIRQWSTDTIRPVIRSWVVRGGTLQKTVHVMVTPIVLQMVREHFDCPTLEGAELEDQGGDGTALTHWEKRIFQNEAMTGTVHTSRPAYSRLTLALLEDSGWYVPDYSKAHPLTWGSGAGCQFATTSCKQIMDQAALEGTNTPFCNSLMQEADKTYCTNDRSSVGSCNLVMYSQELPAIYQNFDHIEGVQQKDIGKVGSSVTLADFCPYVQEFSWRGGGGVGGGEDPRGTRCDDPDNAPDPESNYAVEYFGGGSRCFSQGDPWEQRSCTMIKQWTRYGSGCYNYQCSGGLLNIIVRDITFSCHHQGQKIPIELLVSDWLHTGSIVCPACSSVCQDCSMEGRTAQDHYDKREDLGDCFSKAESEDPNNLLLGFLKEFGNGFNLG